MRLCLVAGARDRATHDVQPPAPIVVERAGPLRGRRWRGALAGLLVLALCVGLLEALLRLAVLVPASHRIPGLWALGQPARFGDPTSDDAYWEVQALAGPAWARRDRLEYDARLGWRSTLFRAGDLEHVAEVALAGRRPMLLLGDSYAEGVARLTRDDFPRLLERTELAGEFLMLNYGVGGYGFDQIALLLHDVLARHAARKPVAIVSLLLDDDLDRCLLSFRSWPKPRLRVEAGRLTPPARRLPTVTEHLEHHTALEPLYLRPFLATLWCRLRPSRKRAQELEKQELARALLREAALDLRGAGVESLFVLFRHAGSIDYPATTLWRRELCAQVLDEHGLPWVDVGPAFVAHRALAGRGTLDYFLPPEHALSGHYNALGDALAFEVIREGLRAHLGLGAGGSLVLAQDVRSHAGRAPSALWREQAPELESLGSSAPYLDLDLDAAGRGGLTWKPRGAARALRARVDLIDAAGGTTSLRLTALKDGALAGEWRLTAGNPLRLELDLQDVREVSLCADERLGDPASRVVLSEVALETSCRLAPPLR